MNIRAFENFELVFHSNLGGDLTGKKITQRTQQFMLNKWLFDNAQTTRTIHQIYTNTSLKPGHVEG